MDKIFSPIKQRVMQFIEYKRIVKEEFYKKTGISASNFKGTGTKSELGGDKIVEILTNYDELNPEWLLLGVEPMLKHELGSDYQLEHVKKLKTDRKKTLQLVPLYDIRATAGVVDILRDDTAKKAIPIEYIQIPNLPKCDGAIPITGDSMYPLLKSGDIVLYREVNDKGNIIWGEMYLLSILHNGDEFFFAKYVQRSERENWVKLVSQNTNHQPVEFPLDSIMAIALIKASIRINTQM